jgi:hypothetical protein
LAVCWKTRVSSRYSCASHPFARVSTTCAVTIRLVRTISREVHHPHLGWWCDPSETTRRAPGCWRKRPGSLSPGRASRCNSECATPNSPILPIECRLADSRRYGVVLAWTPQLDVPGGTDEKRVGTRDVCEVLIFGL